jgi:hypothetical protein
MGGRLRRGGRRFEQSPCPHDPEYRSASTTRPNLPFERPGGTHQEMHEGQVRPRVRQPVGNFLSAVAGAVVIDEERGVAVPPWLGTIT